MDIQQENDGGLRELALFAGAGGGILGGKLAANVASPELQQTQHMEGGPLNCTDTELCTYLQALGEGYLPTYYSDTNQSAESKLTPIASKSYRRGKKMVAFHGFPSLEMSRPSTDDLGEDILMWFLEDSLVKTYPVQDAAQELKESDQGCGSTWQELSVRYDLDSHSWRTHLCLWDEALQWSSVILPKWGMTVSGVLFQHPTAERPINGIGSGLWPTPRSCSEMAATITPESAWNQDRFPNLETVVGRKTWPTPQASDNRDRGNLGSGAIQRRKEKGKQIALSQSVSDTSGALNPLWVEWLMAWPLGWSDLKPLETARFQQWLRLHGRSYQDQNNH